MNQDSAVKNEKKVKVLVDECVTRQRARAEMATTFSHFVTTTGWEALPPILRPKPLAVVTTAKGVAPCLDGKPSQLSNLG